MEDHSLEGYTVDQNISIVRGTIVRSRSIFGTAGPVGRAA
jgi:hypothetical protein